MRILYNGIQEQSNIITFTDIPNILRVEDYGQGSKASITFAINSLPSSTYNGEWYIQLLGETISNVISPENAINKNFYINTGSKLSTVASMVMAFRSCPTIAANFIVEIKNQNVVLTAKVEGVVWANKGDYLQTNMQSYITSTPVDGTDPSSLVGSNISVDIYNGSEYITTLQKSFYLDEVSFNLSPVLMTFARYGYIKPYTINVSSFKNGTYTQLGSISTNYVTIGYMCNQGSKFLVNDTPSIGMNYSRGTNKDAANNTILYVYEPSATITYYTGNAGGFSYSVDWLDSAFNVLHTKNGTSRCDSNSMMDLEFTFDDSGNVWFNEAFYIDVTIGSTKIRFNVIKPIKATEYCQRVYWRNSYGGISFFDFTGQKTETRDVNVTTYQKNIFDYYDSSFGRNELEKVYDNNIKYTVTLKSHLFENDGKYVFNDLIQSASVWTEINGQEYAIIIDSVNVDETDNNGIFEATLKYHYSQNPSLI